MFRLYSNEKLVHNYVHIKNYMYTEVFTFGGTVCITSGISD